MNTIFKRRLALDKAERDAVSKFREEFRKTQKAERDALQAECEAIGHDWKSSGYNITYEVEFFNCVICGKTKCEDA